MRDNSVISQMKSVVCLAIVAKNIVINYHHDGMNVGYGDGHNSCLTKEITTYDRLGSCTICSQRILEFDLERHRSADY